MKTISMTNLNKVYTRIFQKLKINPKSMILSNIIFLVENFNLNYIEFLLLNVVNDLSIIVLSF